MGTHLKKFVKFLLYFAFPASMSFFLLGGTASLIYLSVAVYVTAFVVNNKAVWEVVSILLSIICVPFAIFKIAPIFPFGFAIFGTVLFLVLIAKVVLPYIDSK